MSVRLCLGDAVLVHTIKDRDNIGIIKYIGGMHGGIDGQDIISEYVGIELIEAIENGHNGTIDGYQYFSSPNGHGFHTKLTNVIRKVSYSELCNQLRQLLKIFTNRLLEKDKYIQKLQFRIFKNNSINDGTSKSLHLYPTDSGHIPRRESASISTTMNNNINCTPITSMTPITENCMNHDLNPIKRQSATLTLDRLDIIRDDNLSNHSYSHNSIHSIKRSNKRDTTNTAKSQITITTTTSLTDDDDDDDDDDNTTDHECDDTSITSQCSGYGYTSNSSSNSSNSSNSSCSRYTNITYTDDDNDTYSKKVISVKPRDSLSVTKFKKKKSTKAKKRKSIRSYSIKKRSKQTAFKDRTNLIKSPSKHRDRDRDRDRDRNKDRNSIISKIVIGTPSSTRKSSKHRKKSISKSSRKDSIIKATKNMVEIRNNIIRPHSEISNNNPLPAPPQHTPSQHNRIRSVGMKQFQFIPYPNLQKPQQLLPNEGLFNYNHNHSTRIRKNIGTNNDKDHKLSESLLPDHQPSLQRNNHRSELIKKHKSLPAEIPSLQNRPRSSPAVFVLPSHTPNKQLLLDPPSPSNCTQSMTFAAASRLHSNHSSALSSQTQTIIFDNNNNLNNNNVNNNTTFYIPQSSQSRQSRVSSSNHTNQNSNSFNNQFMMTGMHSTQSSSTITVPSQIEVWTQGRSSGSSISPHTPCTPSTPIIQQQQQQQQQQQHQGHNANEIGIGPNHNMISNVSETQTAYFDPESFLNYRNQTAMTQQQIPSFADYINNPINSIKYQQQQQQQQQQRQSIPSMQTMSIGTVSNVSSPNHNHNQHSHFHSQLMNFHGLPSSLNNVMSRNSIISEKRSGKRTNKQSVISSISTISPNNNHNGYGHNNKMYSLSNNGFAVFGHHDNNNNNNKCI